MIGLAQSLSLVPVNLQRLLGRTDATDRKTCRQVEDFQRFVSFEFSVRFERNNIIGGHLFDRRLGIPLAPRHHYDISVQVGELVLLPAVRRAAPNTLIIANGFSCREQIAQTTNRHALHLAEVMHMALDKGTKPIESRSLET